MSGVIFSTAFFDRAPDGTFRLQGRWSDWGVSCRRLRNTDDHNIAHIARHSVKPAEVEQLIFLSHTVAIESPRRKHRVEVYGTTAAERPLIVCLDVSSERSAYWSLQEQ